ncbi:ATP-dependent DNA helicase RecG [Sulfuriflexus mobilis]|uniref:ATP-dependent DNA helicase RecG n=1 Tax=Sulfuriflexus mobilis TaxID=1811807 RepID=UPI000F82164B|nr:ATP-dependent DNA helicase RecG [Sulfuriflexus mobilis]
MSNDPASLSVTCLKGVGPKVAEKLARLGLHTVQDILFHLPLRYEDRTRVVPIGSLRPGDAAVVQGEVQLTEVKFGKRRSLLSRISDGTGSLTIRLFHFNAAQKASLERGASVRCYGEARRGTSTLELIHPEYRLIQAEESPEVASSLTAVYPTTEGVHQLKLRDLSEQAMSHIGGLREWLPAELLASLGMPTLGEALRTLHRPTPDVSLSGLSEGEHPAQQRLAFEELLAQHLSMRQLRERMQAHQAPALRNNGELNNQFLQQLPFELTIAQQRVIKECLQDLSRAVPMQRLVQGDVGSGKTAVAACAALHAVESGYQVVVMAPTELLAEQHHKNFYDWLAPLGIKVAWLTGSLKAAERREQMAVISGGQAQVVVGTHALFQAEVEFDRLGLVIIDEQHRFGVHQRLALREKGRGEDGHPHQLIMTATPIPRTLAMTFYADLDCSVIDELPPGRTPVTTVVIPDSRRADIVQRVEQACASGRQVYWVCTLIEESEALQCEAAEDTAQALAAALPQLHVGLVHGRMKAADKEAMMRAFKAGEIDLLVATTVIEVGVDVPNASLMVIENAERLGLAQLHQLRGRVGRGAHESNCVLLYRAPLGQRARERLAVMRETTDGFEIARHDLEQRGPGEVLGTRQTGLAMLRIADLVRDQALLPAVEQAARQLMQDYPGHVDPLVRRWIGEATRYADV